MPKMYSFLVGDEGHINPDAAGEGHQEGRFAYVQAPALSRAATEPCGKLPAEPENRQHTPEDLHY